MKTGNLMTYLLPGAVLVMTACVQQGPIIPENSPGGKNVPYKVTINFDTTNNCKVLGVTTAPTPCIGPAPPPGDICAGRNQWVQWESNPPRVGYKIFFDPFKGPPDNANNGILKKKIDYRTPFADYKYSILGDGCNRDTDTFDPRIRIDR